MNMLNAQYDRVFNSEHYVPMIFKEILRRKIVLTEEAEILDFIYMEREYHSRTLRDTIYQKAFLLIVTNTGIIAVQEGTEDDLDVTLGGYRIRYMPYRSITSIEMDSSMLQASLSIYFNGQGEPFHLGFDRARFFNDFNRIASFIYPKIS